MVGSEDSTTAKTHTVQRSALASESEFPARMQTPGPGIGNLSYTQDELFQPISWLDRPPIPAGERWLFGTNVGILLGGYFVTLFAPDSGRGPGGFDIYDVSDPRNIRRVRRIYEPNRRTGQFRESHGLGVAYIGDAVVVAVQSTRGVEFWDFTDMSDIRRASKLALPGVLRGDYSHVAWQLTWQAPYLYVGAASQGMYIVDASDPARPVIAHRGHDRPNPVPPARLGGFPVGPVFAMGNHLVVSSMERDLAWSSLDISDPLNPVLLDTVAPIPQSYSTCFDGRRVYSSPRPTTDAVAVYDLSDPGSFVPVNSSLVLPNRLYCATQDHFLFQGGKEDFRKIDISDDANFVEVGRGILDTHLPDAGQAWPIGNVVFVGNDHGTGSAFFVHDRDPDRTPPRVVEVSPRDGAVNQAVTTRVGIAFSDGILPESLRPEAVHLVDDGGNRVAGTFSVELGIVKFAPHEPLQPHTDYTVSVPRGGLTDYVGNAVDAGFASTFATGGPLPGSPIHRWALADDAQDGLGRNHGTVVGATFGLGGGLRLDGRGDWVRLDHSLAGALSGDASLAFFLATSEVGAATPANAPGVTGPNDPTDAGEVAWGWLDETGRLRLSVGSGEGIQSPQPVNDGQVHHYVLIRSAATGELTMYRDGVKIARGTGDTGAKGGGGYGRLGAIDGSTASLSGILEDVQIFDRVLGDDDIRQLYGRADTAFTQATLDAVVLVGLASEFEAEDLGGVGTTYQWDFGDGTSTAASTSRSARHVYTRPGHHTVVLRVRVDGILRHYNFFRTVTHPRTSVAPASSSPINGSGEVVYRVNPGNGSLTGIDRTRLERVWETHVGKHPRTVAVDRGGRAWVAVQGDDKLACVEPAGRACGTIGLGHGSAPYGVAFVPDTDTGLVTLQGSGEVLRFDAATGSVLGRRSVNAEPRGIAISGDGAHAYVTRLRSPATGLVTKISVPTLARVSDIALAVDDTTVDGEDRARGKPNYLTHVAISPDGRTAWVPAKQDNVLRGLMRDGNALTHDSAVRAIASLLDVSGNRELRTERIDFNDRSGAVAVAFSPRGDYAFVVLQGSNSVAIADAYSGAVRGALEGAGLAPHGIWIDEQALRAFVTNFTTRSVEVYDISPVLDGTSFEPGPIVEINAVATERLDAQTLRGLRIFYNARDPRMSLDGYISCASCHLDGGEDGTVWDFTDRGEGLRNSISLNGREGTRLGNLHWTANFDEVQDFENDIRNAFGGHGFMADTNFDATSQPLGWPKAGRSSELDALARYVASLGDYGKSPHRTESGELTAPARDGRLLFAQLGCQSCHAGPEFTDGQRHDVGTVTPRSGQGSNRPLAGVGFKTPALRGAWRTAPYFHDGSAATLGDVIASRHGGEQALDSGESDALLAFLRSLEGPAARYMRIENLTGLRCWQATGGAVQNLSAPGCTSDDSRLWRFDSMGRIHPKADDGLCVESQGQSAYLQLAPCSGSARQQWHVADQQIASVADPDLVVIVRSGDLWTRPRNGTAQARWQLVASAHDRPELSDVTSLSGLTLQGVDIGAFQTDVRDYEAVVGIPVTQVTVAATPSSGRGGVLIGRVGDMEEGATRTIDLIEGENRILVEVVAEDDQLSRVYTVTVRRSGLPVVSIVAVAETVSEGEPAAFRVSRTGPTTAELAVEVTTTTSREPQASPGSVRLLPGQGSREALTLLPDDTVVRDRVTVTKRLEPGAGYIIAPNAASATVVGEENDVAEFAMSANPGRIDEGESATLTVEISNGVEFAEDQTIELAVSGTASAADYTLSPEVLTLVAGSRSATAAVTATRDAEEEPDE
ncbi:MAG: PKD domain-containing protein, partial [Chloroflexi bacterium]|nr:PKD domain-containing protein [Chloroflexota bacterium]